MSDSAPSDLFGAAALAELERRAPLATRMRPRSLDDVVGQSDLLEKGSPLRSLIETDRLSSAIFFGPAGTGKTTVARLAAETSAKSFVQLSAVSASVRDVREVLTDARRLLGERGRGTILFLDEIHRFSRTQQDALLPGVEEGLITLIGATTENPYFALNPPLLSRSALYRFQPLSEHELETVARRALALERATTSDEALRWCCGRADGDARSMLMTLDIALAIAATTGNVGEVNLALEMVEAARPERIVHHGADEHYDLLSVFIKSMRGSDPDASIYWLARLLEAGEDPRVIARRLVILASEDIGLADPMSLLVAEATAGAVDRVGLPEVSLNLAQATLHLALAPKSNRSMLALSSARDDIENDTFQAVPARFKDSHYKGASALGHGVGYEYPHNDPQGHVAEVYLPEELAGRRYYEPTDRGFEAELSVRLRRLRNDGSKDPADDQADEVT